MSKTTFLNSSLENATLDRATADTLVNTTINTMFPGKFIEMGKFHSPGLAPVRDRTGAYHINTLGEAAYIERYSKTFGFYENLAGVEDNSTWFHITPGGERAYSHHYDWVGNFQENLCVVKQGNKFFHIRPDGSRAYSQGYDYVGDFKDGSAVVYQRQIDAVGQIADKADQDIYKDGGNPDIIYNNAHQTTCHTASQDTYKTLLATHIDYQGNYIHNTWFKQLYNYHKGYACAEDECGWCHINAQGSPIYLVRYKTVEPFYNTLARVEKFDGAILQIDVHNNVITTIKAAQELKVEQLTQRVTERAQAVQTAQAAQLAQKKEKKEIDASTAELFSDLVGFWKVHVIGVAAQIGILNLIPSTIDEMSQSTGIPVTHLNRLLRALWEIKILSYDVTTGMWALGAKGQILQQSQYSFLTSAAIMWREVALQQKWQSLAEILSQDKIRSHASFKDLASDNTDCNVLHCLSALNGYLKLDLEELVSELRSLGLNHVLVIGKSASILVKEWKKYSLGLHIGYVAEPIGNIEAHTIKNGYQTIVFLKNLLHYDDEVCASLLGEASSVANVENIVVIEPMLNVSTPSGSLLDINMLVESGGNLRYIEDYITSFSNMGYNIARTCAINPYLHMIYARKK